MCHLILELSAVSCQCRLKHKLNILSRKLRQADDMFWWSNRRTWLRYIPSLKKIWNDTRDHQRAVDALWKEMQVQLVPDSFSASVLTAVSIGGGFCCRRGEVARRGGDRAN